MVIVLKDGRRTRRSDLIKIQSNPIIERVTSPREPLLVRHLLTHQEFNKLGSHVIKSAVENAHILDQLDMTQVKESFRAIPSPSKILRVSPKKK